MTRYLPLVLLIALCMASCKGRKSGDGGYIDSTAFAQNNPTEDEITTLADTAQQEQPAVLPERYEGLHIYVSKTKMRLYVLTATDSVVFQCGIACGIRKGNKTEKGDYKTPEGKFHISGMFNSTDWVHHTKDGRSVKGCYGPHFLRLGGGRFLGIGIHGTNSPRSIGRRASEGCIRVNSANIVILFNQYAYYGMPVEVGAEGALLPWEITEETGTPTDATDKADTAANHKKEETKASGHSSVQNNDEENVDSLFD